MPGTAQSLNIGPATFIDRDRCISCRSASLSRVAGGKFGEDPVRSFIENSPWGVQPMPYIEDSDWELVRCDDCKQAFHRYILSPEWQQKRFSEWMGQNAIRKFEHDHGMDSFSYGFQANRERAEHILKIERLTRSIRSERDRLRLLDFGCGWGSVPALATLFGCKAYGVDRDAHRLGANVASRVYPDLSSLDAATRRQPFHAVTLFEVIEHLDDPLTVLHLMSDRMAAGGILVLEAPNCEGVSGIHTEIDYDLIHPLEHINCFTASSLAAMAARAGFKVVRSPAAHVTTDLVQVAKTVVKKAISAIRPMTRLYFRRT